MKGICFKEPLFHATIEGRKTQTRRIVNPQPDNIRSITQKIAVHPGYEISEKVLTPAPAYHFLTRAGKYIYPRYKVGEVLYLKEPYVFFDEKYLELKTRNGIELSYKFGNKLTIEELTGVSDIRWENKLFMPASAARYFIKITDVRAERLQDISEEDCLREGIECIPVLIAGCGEYLSYGLKSMGIQAMTSHEAYAALIDKINGKSTWDSNPWVWVFDYELTEKPE